MADKTKHSNDHIFDLLSSETVDYRALKKNSIKNPSTRRYYKSYKMFGKRSLIGEEIC